MELKDLEKIAKYKMANWKHLDGIITNYDVENGVLTLGGKEFTVNKNAKKQMVDRLKLHGTIKDFSDNPEFQQKAFQQKIEDLDRQSRIIYDVNSNEAKAVKTPRYNIMQDYTALKIALTKYEDFYDPKYSHINDKGMNLSFTNIKELSIVPEKNKADKGDIISFGNRVWNSLNGSLGVGQIMVRLLCTNGMTSNETIDTKRTRHMTYIDLEAELLKNLNSILDPQKTAALISSAMSRPARLKAFVAVDDEESTRPWHKLLSKYQISGIHHEGVMNAHIAEPIGTSPEGVNGWGIFNAVTRYNTHEYARRPEYDTTISSALMSNAYPLLSM